MVLRVMHGHHFSSVVLLFITGSAQAATPSFSCTAGTDQVEKTICADDELSKLDTDMGRAFSSAYASAVPRQALLAGQRTWLARRSECFTKVIGDPGTKQAIACLRGRYARRVAFLKRPMDLRPANLCHMLADAITFANGYVGLSPFYSIIDDATIDALGAITRNPAIDDQSSQLIEQAKKIDPPKAGEATRFYVMGSKGGQVIAAETFSGTLACQDVNFYAVRNARHVDSVDAPAGQSDECRGDWAYFADVPSSGPDERAADVKETPTLRSVEIEANSWTDSKWNASCGLDVSFSTKLGPVHAACQKQDECAALATHALAVATLYDRLQASDMSPPASGKSTTRNSAIPNCPRARICPKKSGYIGLSTVRASPSR